MVSPAAPRLPAGERIRRVGIAAWSIIGILILLYIAFRGLVLISVIFPPLVFALLLIYLLNPLVTRFEKRGMRRGLAVGVAYILVLGMLTLLLMAIIPPVSDQISEFSDDWPEFRSQAAHMIEDTASSFERRFNVEIDASQISCLLGADDDVTIVDGPTHSECDEVTEELRERFAASAGRISEVGLTVLEALLVFILAPLLALYLLIDLPHLQRDLLHLVPEANREEMADLGSKVGRAIGGFFRGQLLVALTVGVLSAVGFKLIGLPFWLIIGAIAGFFNLIPLIGPFIGGAIGFFVGVVSDDFSLGLKAVIVEVIVQQLDNHVISPNIMKRTVNLHPVTVMLSILAGGAVGGFWGVLLGVPFVAVVKLILGHVWATRVLGEEVSPYAVASSARAKPPSVVPDEDEAAPDGEDSPRDG